MEFTLKVMLFISGIGVFFIFLHTRGVWIRGDGLTRIVENDSTAPKQPLKALPENLKTSPRKPLKVVLENVAPAPRQPSKTFPRNVTTERKQQGSHQIRFTTQVNIPPKMVPKKEAISPKEPLKEAPTQISTQGEPLPNATYPDWFRDAWERSPATRFDAFVSDRPLFPEFPYCKPERSNNSAKRYPFIEPRDYIRQSKNPCWYKDITRKRSFRCLPYFYIAGVAKCGTTDLYRRLRLHPDVMRGSLKEYHFWDRERFGNVEVLGSGEAVVHRKPWTFEHYLELITREEDLRRFEEEVANGTNVTKIFGDGSPSYLWNILNWELLVGNEGCDEPRFVNGQHIRHIYPHSKIILIFRHPTPRLYSRFLSRLWRTPYLNGSTSATFHDYVARAVRLYKDCFKVHSIRQCAYNFTIFDDAVVRLVEGMYPVFMADWLRIWPRDQMLLLRSEDYAVDFEGTMLKAFDFLGVAKWTEEDHDRIMDHPMANVGTQYGNLGPMLPETVKILDEFYQPFVDKFAEILQDPRFLWKDVYPPEKKELRAAGETVSKTAVNATYTSRSLLTTMLVSESPWLRTTPVQSIKALPGWATLVLSLSNDTDEDDEPDDNKRSKDKDENADKTTKRSREIGLRDEDALQKNKGAPPGWVSDLLIKDSNEENNKPSGERSMTRIEVPPGIPIKKARYPTWFWKAWSKSITSKLGDLYFEDKPFFPPCVTKARSSAKVKPYSLPEPREYLPTTKNPCWYQNPLLRKGFHCLPYYYIVGVSNCGTADLNRRLHHHPDVMKGSMKEYHWWDRGRFGDIYSDNLYDHGEELRGIRIPFKEYTELIMGKQGSTSVLEDLNTTGTSDIVFGDHSPSYFSDVKLWSMVDGNQGCDEPRVTLGHTIHYMTPKAKIILVVRHPTPRLYTEFLSRLPDSVNLRGSAASFAFHRLVIQSVAMYKDCFERWSVRRCAYNTTLYLKDKVRLWEGMYSVFLMDWLRVFHRSQIHVIRYRDLIRDTSNIISGAFRFLELPPLNTTLLRSVVADKWVDRREQHELRRYFGPMVPETVDILNDFYEPFVDKFAEMLNDERFSWRDIDHL